jgi:hypothetical protein
MRILRDIHIVGRVFFPGEDPCLAPSELVAPRARVRV